jgi:serine/threonine-protein kinase HipA
VATRSPPDILRLLDAAILNLIIGNADAHAKNFGLLLKDGAIVLAPLYHLFSTVLYPELSPKLAMKIGGKHLLKELDPRHWHKFAADCGLSAPFVRTHTRQLCEAVIEALDSAFTAPA